MRLSVDQAKCQGHTVCGMAAPELFGSSDDDGHAIVLVPDVPEQYQESARLAEASCPERAIAIEE